MIKKSSPPDDQVKGPHPRRVLPEPVPEEPVGQLVLGPHHEVEALAVALEGVGVHHGHVRGHDHSAVVVDVPGNIVVKVYSVALTEL